MTTFAASLTRIPRTGLIALVALVAAFALLMVVRLGVLGGADSSAPSVTAPPKTAVTATSSPTAAASAKPKVVLLPGLPASIANKLRYSRVVVVSLYVGQVPGDRAAVAEARKGARASGAGFVAVNVGDDRTAASVASFVGPVMPPSMLVVRRPGKIVTQIAGPVERAVVTQAAHNAGARR